MEKRPNKLVDNTAVDWLRKTLDEQPILGQSVITGLVLVATVILGAIIGTALAGGGGGPGTAEASGLVGLRPAVVGELIVAPKAEPTVLEKPRGMGSRKSGIALLALGRVSSVETESEIRRAPEGSRMIAFRVGDWVCEEEPCDGWSALDPQISIDGMQSSLEEGQSTYVVVVPPGTSDVTLEINADDFPQSLSLLGDGEGQNITLLADEDNLDPVKIEQRFQLAERTSTPLTGPDGLPTDTFFRTVSLGVAQRHFFLGEEVPNNPDEAFLVITMAYSYAGQTQASAFDPAEVTFVLPGGRVVEPRDLDPDPNMVSLGFEIPAKSAGGTLTFGGVLNKTSTTGVAYTTTLESKKIKVDLTP